jgi:hypothetical protein
MDSIPFLHANRYFTILFVDDLAFAEVREILDRLIARDAFDPDVQRLRGRYRFETEESCFSVWVADKDVYIRRE